MFEQQHPGCPALLHSSKGTVAAPLQQACSFLWLLVVLTWEQLPWLQPEVLLCLMLQVQPRSISDAEIIKPDLAVFSPPPTPAARSS